MKIKLGIAVLFLLAFIAGCREDIVEFSETSRTGTLYIYSDPDGAEIFLNDIRLYKTTPDSLINMQPGSYFLRLRLAGYPDESVEIDVVSGQSRSVNVNFGQSSSSID